MSHKTIMTDPTLSFFDYLDTDSTDERALHNAERTARGFSRYDWFNFCDYLAYLFAQVCEEIAHGRIKLADNADHARVTVAAQGYIKRYEEYLVMPEEVFGSEHPLAYPFFEDIFPHLLASPERYYTPILAPSNQRAAAGFSNEDALVIRSYLTSIMIDGINMFAGPLAHGYRGESQQSWAEKLGEMEYYLGILQAHSKYIKDTGGYPSWFKEEDMLRFENGKHLLIDNFDALWD